MQGRREQEYPTLAAQNADDPGVDNTGLPEPQKGEVKITATTDRDLHLGDERVIHGNGHGMLGEMNPDTGALFERPQQAMVTRDLADALVKAGKASRA